LSLSVLTKELYNQFIAVTHSNSVAGSNFRSLSNILYCWLKNWVWTVSQFQCDWSSSQIN